MDDNNIIELSDALFGLPTNDSTLEFVEIVTPSSGIYDDYGNLLIISNSSNPPSSPLNPDSIVNHMNDITIHFKQSGITITENQVINLTGDLANRSLTGHTHSQYLINDDLNPYYTGVEVDQHINAATSGLTSSWDEISNKPSWLSGLTLSQFESNHTHSQYLINDDLNPYYTGIEVDQHIDAATSGLTSSWNEVTDRPSWLSGSTLSQFESGHNHNSLVQPNGLKIVAYTDNDNNLHIDGNIIQNGDTYETHAEQVYTKNDLIILRDKAISGLANGAYTGFISKKYDGINDGYLVFDNTGIARVGNVGQEQPLATRIELPKNGQFSFWDSTNYRLDFKTMNISDIQDLQSYLDSKINLNQSIPQNVSNGVLIFDNGIKLGLTPTGTTDIGSLYYDAPSRTISAKITDDVTMQIGQEELVLCLNNTGSDIINGSMVYVTGSSDDMPTIALAKADNDLTYIPLGMATQTIPSQASGFVTNRGIIHDIDTSDFMEGQTLYLSPYIAGAITNVAYNGPDIYLVKIGVALIIDSVKGSVYVRQLFNNRFADLVDVRISNPVVDQTLRFNGIEWVNGNASSVTVGLGTTFYLTRNFIVSGDTESTSLHTLEKAPIMTSEVIDTVVANNEILPLGIYLYDKPIGGTQIDAGVWTFNTYCDVDSLNSNSEILVTIRRVISGGTISISGSGTTRTATSSDALFTLDDANIDALLCGMLQTPEGIFYIKSFISSSVVTIASSAAYTNEIDASYSIHRFLFTDSNTKIDNVDAGLTSSQSVQQAFSINNTDKLSASYYAKTDATINVTFRMYYSGNDHYTHFITPLAIRHNDLSGIQGGNLAEKYHLTLDQINIVNNTSGINRGDQPLNWTDSGHVGIPNTLAGFNYSGAAKVLPINSFATSSGLTDHISDTVIHYPQSGITINENQVLNLTVDLDNRSLTGHTHSQYLVANDIVGKENIINKVSGITSGSTNSQYPTAKLLYDQLATKQSIGSYLTTSGGTVDGPIMALSFAVSGGTSSQSLKGDGSLNFDSRICHIVTGRVTFSAGTGKGSAFITTDMNNSRLTRIECYLTASGSTPTIVNIQKNGLNAVLSTACIIPAFAKSSSGSTPYVIDTNYNLGLIDDEFSVNIISSGTGAAGLNVLLTFTKQ